jgi:hypothetical protein
VAAGFLFGVGWVNQDITVHSAPACHIMVLQPMAFEHPPICWDGVLIKLARYLIWRKPLA